jgi:RHS repeat-associated protein
MPRLCSLFALAMLLAPSAALAQDVVVYYHTDAVGSVRMITDETGAVIHRYDYLPFGERWDSPPNPNPDVRQFVGNERDAETGLDYVGARYYRPQSGMFTTVDPGHVNGDVLDPQSWNAYAYARNNPLKYTDPTGTTYEICAYALDGMTRTCGSVSDQYFGILERNPGAGLRLSGGTIFAGDKAVGSYLQTRVDPTFDDFTRLTGELSSRWLREQSTDMAKGAALTAATFGTGVAARAALEVIMAARTPNLVFKTATFGQKLTNAGVDVASAKAAVGHAISSRLGNRAPVGVLIKGTVSVGGRVLEFTAMRLASGEISVGSIRALR